MIPGKDSTGSLPKFSCLLSMIVFLGKIKRTFGAGDQSYLERLRAGLHAPI